MLFVSRVAVSLAFGWLSTVELRPMVIWHLQAWLPSPKMPGSVFRPCFVTKPGRLNLHSERC